MQRHMATCQANKKICILVFCFTSCTTAVIRISNKLQNMMALPPVQYICLKNQPLLRYLISCFLSLGVLYCFVSAISRHG